MRAAGLVKWFCRKFRKNFALYYPQPALTGPQPLGRADAALTVAADSLHGRACRNHCLRGFP
jgi:hypothetical protein